MKKIALSAIVAIVASGAVFHGVLWNGGSTVDATTTVTTVFAFAGAVAFGIFVAFGVATAFAFIFAAALTVAAAVAAAFAVAAFAAFAFAVVIYAELQIPCKWVIGVYIVEAVTLTVVFLAVSPIASVASVIVGCGLIGVIWRLYNHSPQLATAKL